jgi:hypothetical protein
MAVKPSPTLPTRIRELGTLVDFADKLDEPVDSVSEVFKNWNPTPTSPQLDVIILIPAHMGSPTLVDETGVCFIH